MTDLSHPLALSGGDAGPYERNRRHRPFAKTKVSAQGVFDESNSFARAGGIDLSSEFIGVFASRFDVAGKRRWYSVCYMLGQRVVRTAVTLSGITEDLFYTGGCRQLDDLGTSLQEAAKMKLRRQGILIALTSVFALAAAQAASAAPILTFGQVGSGTPITATNNGAGSTTIVGTNVAIDITGIAGGVGTGPAFLTLGATSTNAAAPVGVNGVIQNYSGTFCITSLAGCLGTNYLSGSFTDVALGQGTSLVLAAAQPTDTVSFTSAVIPLNLLDLPRALAFGFAGVNPAVSIVNGSIGSFTSSVAGTFSAEASPVPEPASLLLFGSGLVAVARRLRRRSA